MTARVQTCRSCGANQLEPCFDGLVVCSSCCLLQRAEDRARDGVRRITPPDPVQLDEDRLQIEERIARRKLGAGHQVVEVESADGRLLQYYVKNGVPVLGIEASEELAAIAVARGVPTLHARFTLDVAIGLRQEGTSADLVYAVGLLDRAADPNLPIAGICMLIKDEGQVLIECRYVLDRVHHNEPYTVPPEHQSCFSLTSLASLLERHGLHLQDAVRVPGGSGSLRCTAGREERESDAVRELLAAESRAGLDCAAGYAKFGERAAELREHLRELLENLKGQGACIAAWGSPAEASAFLDYLGPDNGPIAFVVDPAAVSSAGSVPGRPVPVLALEALVQHQPEYTLLLGRGSNDDVIREQASYRDAGGRFIVPTPRPEIL